MTKENAFEQIQLMHERSLITEDSIIGWYYFYSHKLPKMRPERSSADILRTISLWMELTDKGGAPGFPFEYKTTIKIPVEINTNKMHKLIIEISWILIILGLVLLFFHLALALSTTSLGVFLLIATYYKEGSSKNIASATGLKSGRRVFDWIQTHTLIEQTSHNN